MLDRDKTIEGLERLLFFGKRNDARLVKETCESAIMLLKAQEPPVQPIVGGDGNGDGATHWYACGACETDVSPGDRYCRYCGRRIQWDES